MWRDMKCCATKKFPTLLIQLKYSEDREPVIRGLERVSKPGCRDLYPARQHSVGQGWHGHRHPVLLREACSAGRRGARALVARSSARFGKRSPCEREVMTVSRIGRMPIPVTDAVKVSIDGNRVKVVGPKGELEREFHPTMRIKQADGELVVERPDDSRQSRALHGLTRALLANMVTGVTEGFQKQLQINGVGFRAEEKGQGVVLQIGYSHPVEVNPPEGIRVRPEAGGRIVVEGIDKELVGEVAAKIRAVRKPEPYQGKGIAYVGEVIRRKAGKAGRAGGA